MVGLVRPSTCDIRNITALTFVDSNVLDGPGSLAGGGDTMTGRTASRREALQALGVAAVGAIGAGTAGGQETKEATVTVAPSEVTLTAGSPTTIDVVVVGAQDGIGAYEFDLVVDPSVVTFVEFEENREEFTYSAIQNDGAVMHFETALLDNGYQGAEEIAIAEVTLGAESAGQSAIDVDIIAGIQDPESNPYETTSQEGQATVESDQTLSADFEVSPAEPATGETVTFDASNSTGEIAEYRWDLSGDGTVDTTTTGPQTTFTYDEVGERTVTLEIEDGNGNTDQTSQTVPVTESGPELDAAFELSPTDPITGETVTFDAGGSTGDVAEYRWDLTGDGTVDTATPDPQTTFTYDEPGERTVTLEIEDGNGNTDQTSQTVPVTELEPTFERSPAGPAPGETVTFDASGSTGNIVTYTWTFDDGTELTTDEPVINHTYDATGEYTVTLEIGDGNNNTRQTSRTVTVTESTAGLDAAFEFSPAEPATGAAVSFDASGSTGEVVEYRWAFGDGTEETTQEPTVSHTYESAGQFTVTLEIEGSGGETSSATAEQSVAESTPPEPTAAVAAQPSALETGGEVTLDAGDSTGEIVEYRWDLSGNGTVDTTTEEPILTHTYDSPGTRLVEVIVVDGADQTDSATVEVSVTEPAPPLAAAFQVDPADPVTGEAVTFDASSSAGEVVEYRWAFGDGTEETTQEPTVSHTYGEAGTVSVELTVVDSADQEDTATRTLDIGDGSDDTDDSTDGSDDTDDSTDDTDDTDDSTDGTDNSGDGSGPGFGPASIVAGLGGVGYLLKRRLSGEDTEE
jgi:PKD repeat protein